MKKYRKLACILAGSMTMSLFAGCIGNGDVVPEEKNKSTDTEEPTASETSQEIKKAESRDIDQVHLRDKDSLYENDDDTSVVTMYLTVSKGNSSENTDHTWEEINSYSVYDYEEMGVDRYQVAALLQIGDENGPTEGMVGYGENVPNATVMMVENAERFGLAQLHQLRGRVGRSEHQSFCIFVDTQNSEKSKQRLQILAHSNDGFDIAEQDLRLRGPGDIFGVRQSGALDFAIADIYEDGALLREAAEDAAFVLKTDAGLSLPEHAELRKALDRFLAKSCTL